MTNIKAFVSTVLAACAVNVATAANAPSRTVGPGQTWVVPATTHLNFLKIEAGGVLTAPSGYSLTLTVDGVEMGQVLTSTEAVTDQFEPGTYFGNIVLTVALANPVDFAAGPGAPQEFPFRQALYLDSTGIVQAKSVPAAVFGRLTGNSIKDVGIASWGQDFNGVYAAGGSHTVQDSQIFFLGDGRSDFAGYGAAVTATGTDTKLVLDGVHILTRGVVRTAVVATGGSNVTVKNSSIYTRNGVLPSDYQQTVNLAQMRSVPWMLGINGFDNVRATNLLGPASIASYVNSSIASEGWGVLSTDSGSGCTLTAINSRISITPGNDGYGSYAIGNATEYFLGAEFDVGSYATINTGGAVHYGDSTPEAVAKLNGDLSIGLSNSELVALRARPTVINSRRFGVMWHSSAGTVDVTGGTVINTVEDTFLDKSAQAITITVDGSSGARLKPANGIILQVMDDDDPGPQGPDVLNDGVYVEPTTAPVRDTTFDVTATASAAVASFSNISLAGNFYNSSGWTLMASSGGGGPGGPPPAGKQNMALTFSNSRVTGIITSSSAHHHVATIDSTQYRQLGEVTNTPSAAINNGTIVSLTNGSRWTVTGTSYLTKLSIAVGSTVSARGGHSVSMTVNGVATPIAPGNTYTGAIVISATP